MNAKVDCSSDAAFRQITLDMCVDWWHVLVDARHHAQDSVDVPCCRNRRRFQVNMQLLFPHTTVRLGGIGLMGNGQFTPADTTQLNSQVVRTW